MILEQRKTKELSRLALARFANRAQRAAKVRGEVNVLLTSDAELERLNLQFRGKASPTDVLSFPAQVPAAGSAALPVAAAAGGDIAISVATARAQAAALGHSLLTEVKVLILHGMLHLAGHDHERDRGQMRRLEQRLRRELHLPSGLIERAEIKRTEKRIKAASGAPRAAARKPGRSSVRGTSGKPLRKPGRL